MSIRIRQVEGKTIALCAARSVPKIGDIYLDDEIHHGLSAQFARDHNQSHDYNAAMAILKFPGLRRLSPIVLRALDQKFSRDYNAMFEWGLGIDIEDERLVEQEESNNKNRDWWDKTYGQYSD